MRNASVERQEKIPHSHDYPPHEERARMDLLRQENDDPLALTEHERAAGQVRPLWVRYLHVSCGTVGSFRFYDAADVMARDPQRLSFRWMGLICRGCEAGKDLCPIFGDLRGREPELRWVDTAGNIMPVWVGE